MRQVVYLDVLLFINIIVNYFLVLITAIFTGEIKRRGRVALAAFGGSLFSLVILLPPLHLALSFLIKVAGAFAMAMLAFGVRPPRRIFKNAAFLFAASSLLAGAVYAAREWLGNGAFLSHNLGVYIDLAPLTLILTALGCYLLLTLYGVLFRRPGKSGRQVRVRIVMPGGGELEVFALVDSGNKLCDALSGRSAIVVKDSLAPRLLSPPQLRALESGAADAAALTDIGDFALLPFTSVGGQGLLVGFGAQYALVTAEKKPLRIERPLVAFTRDGLLSEYDAVIGSDAMEE